MELEINEKFRLLIPALDRNESELLMLSLRAEGCRQPITVWKGKNIIVDGHNRYAVCTKLNIPFEIEEMEFEDEYSVMIWMINNQFARRNLSIEYRLDLACKLKEVEQEKAEARMLAGKKVEENTLASHDARVNKKGKSLAQIAEKAGTSTRTAERYDTIQRKGTDEQKEALRSGQKKIGTVYKEIQAKEKPAEKTQSNECDIEKLLKGKTIKTPYLIIYSKQDAETGQEMRAELSNCQPSAKLQMCADSIIKEVSDKCNEDDVMQVRLTIKRVISELILKETKPEAADA